MYWLWAFDFNFLRYLRMLSENPVRIADEKETSTVTSTPRCIDTGVLMQIRVGEKGRPEIRLCSQARFQGIRQVWMHAWMRLSLEKLKPYCLQWLYQSLKKVLSTPIWWNVWPNVLTTKRTGAVEGRFVRHGAQFEFQRFTEMDTWFVHASVLMQIRM